MGASRCPLPVRVSAVRESLLLYVPLSVRCPHSRHRRPLAPISVHSEPHIPANSRDARRDRDRKSGGQDGLRRTRRMLSYMVPCDAEKPPLDLGLHHHQQQQGGGKRGAAGGGSAMRSSGSRSSALSAESTASTVSAGGGEAAGGAAGSGPGPASGGGKAGRVNGASAKHPTLKRVSFGSSKGSMVETLIYESPLQEEPEPVSPLSSSNEGSECSSGGGKASKVRVTFFECERPQTLSSPEPGSDLGDSLDLPVYMASTADHLSSGSPYQRQASTDSGWDNPFRPDGDLSKEADEIVELIRGGKPITPTTGSVVNGQPIKAGEETTCSSSPLTSRTQEGETKAAAPKTAVNGKTSSAGQVDVKRVQVGAPTDASQVERVKLSKKPKSKCCVIQ